MARLSVELQRFFFGDEGLEVAPLAKTVNGEQVRLTQPDTIRLAEILNLAQERAFGFLFVIVSLPSALPIPAPGYSMPFGAVILILAAQLVAGTHRPRLPQRLENGTMKRETAQKIASAGIPWLRRLENLARPRLSYICRDLPGRATIGAAIALMGLFMMIPIPGTNTLPAMGVFICGVGLAEDDGAIALGGLAFCLFAAAVVISIFGTLIWGGSSLIDSLKLWLGG